MRKKNSKKDEKLATRFSCSAPYGALQPNCVTKRCFIIPQNFDFFFHKISVFFSKKLRFIFRFFFGKFSDLDMEKVSDFDAIFTYLKNAVFSLFCNEK